MSKLTRRELGILAGATAVVGSATPEAKAENRTDVPMFEVAQDIRWWTCTYCGEKNGGYTKGPWRVYRCKNPVCPDEWVSFTHMYADMLLHVERTGDKLLSADDPRNLRVGWVAYDETISPYAPQSREWTIPIIKLARPSKEDLQTLERIRVLGLTVSGPTDRAKFAAFLTKYGRAKVAGGVLNP